MPLNDADLKALQVLLQQELQQEIEPLRSEMNKRFDEVAVQLDGLYRENEKREQEYLVLTEQSARLEGRVDVLEKKCA